jgi:hypothetical protein
MGPIGFFKTSVTNYQSALRNIPQAPRFPSEKIYNVTTSERKKKGQSKKLK